MKQEALFDELWSLQLRTYAGVLDYMSIPLHFEGISIYQAEKHIINWIGHQPGITISELSEALKKTPSACSQKVKKLVGFGIAVQNRNPSNLRVYNLYLTEKGNEIFKKQIEQNERAQDIISDELKDISEEEIRTYMQVQEKINEGYRKYRGTLIE